MTLIRVRAAPGRARLTITDGPIGARVITTDDTGARVGLVATEALLLGGDHIEIEVDVGPGAWLELVETAGTVAYDAEGRASSWTVRIRIGDGGRLFWAGEPFVVSHGANVRRSTTIELGIDAVACLRETLVLGRTGEVGGALESTLSVRQNGTLLMAEHLDLTGIDERVLPGIVGDARVLDTVSLLGMGAPQEPELAAGNRFDLDGPGAVARWLGAGYAASPLVSIRTSWEAAAAGRPNRQAVAAAMTL
ncbi:urease accessory protein UreD [Nakamurella sp. GG22]